MLKSTPRNSLQESFSTGVRKIASLVLIIHHTKSEMSSPSRVANTKSKFITLQSPVHSLSTSASQELPVSLLELP